MLISFGFCLYYCTYQIAVNITEHIDGGLQIDYSGFALEETPDFGGDFIEILGKHLGIEILQMSRWILKHGNDALQGCG